MRKRGDVRQQPQRLSSRFAAQAARPGCMNTEEEGLTATAEIVPASVYGSRSWPDGQTGMTGGVVRETELSLVVNGEPVTLAVQPFATLAAVLRDELGLTGTK